MHISKLPRVNSSQSSHFYYKLYFFLPVEWGKEEHESREGLWLGTSMEEGGSDELTFEQMVKYRKELIEGGYTTRVYSHRIMTKMEFMPDETVQGAIEWTEKHG